MARTTTINHALGMWDAGDHPADDAPNDMNANWDSIDAKLWGAGNAFPLTYKIGGFFVRKDTNCVYENVGTASNPLWDECLDGTPNVAAHAHTNKTELDSIDSTSISNWEAAFGWGAHTSGGYLTNQALTDTVANTVMRLPAGTIVGDVTLPQGVLVKGAGIGNTILAGNITTGTAVGSLKDLTITGNLVVNGSTAITNVHCTGTVTVNADVQSYNFTIEKADGVALTVTNGRVTFVTNTIATTGAFNTIEQSGGMLVLKGVNATNNNGTQSVVNSTGGVFVAETSYILNTGGGASVNLANGATAPANALLDLVIAGGISCGTSNTIVENVSGSAVSGSNLVTHTHAQYLTAEVDPLFSASPVAGIVTGDITNWNNAYSSMDAYTPNTPGDWDGTAPTTTSAAIDRIAAALNGGLYTLGNPIP